MRLQSVKSGGSKENNFTMSKSSAIKQRASGMSRVKEMKRIKTSDQKEVKKPISKVKRRKSHKK